MVRRSILSAVERSSLLAIPVEQDDLIRYYTLNELDQSLIRQRRGDANRLGFAIQLCLLRYPSHGLSVTTVLPPEFVQWVSGQLHIDPLCLSQYAERKETRREHLLELRHYLALTPFGLSHFRRTVDALAELAFQTDKGVVLAAQALDTLSHRHIIIPSMDVIERVCIKAITSANRRIYEALTGSLSSIHRQRLDNLLKNKEGNKTTWLAWLRQSPVKPNSRHMLEHIERLKAWQALDLPTNLERNRGLKPNGTKTYAKHYLRFSCLWNWQNGDSKKYS